MDTSWYSVGETCAQFRQLQYDKVMRSNPFIQLVQPLTDFIGEVTEPGNLTLQERLHVLFFGCIPKSRLEALRPYQQEEDND